MPTPKKGPRLASSPAHERLMLANMATSLFQNGRITTTLPKAKRLRPLAERLITFAKRGDLHSRRRVMRVIRNKSVVHILFTQIAEQMEQREGGYTRIVKIAPRVGDAAPAAVIELVTEPVAKKAVVKEAEAAAKVVDASPLDESATGDNRVIVKLDHNTTEAGAYPIVLVSYDIACPAYKDADTAKFVKSWLTYVVSDEGQQTAASAAGSAPLSDTMRQKVLKSIDAIETK